MDPQVADGVQQIVRESWSIYTGFGWVLWGIGAAVLVLALYMFGCLRASSSQCREEERAAAGNASHVKAMMTAGAAGNATVAPPAVRTHLTTSGREAAKLVALLAAVAAGIVLIVALRVWAS